VTIEVYQAPAEGVEILKFLDYLQKREKDALGFLPWAAFEQALEKGRVLLCYDNDDPAGYLIHGPVRPVTKIYQTVVCDDVRRILHGTALVEAVTERANAGHARRISLHCAEDLEANKFWEALEFKKTGQRCRRKDGSRMQNRFEIILPGDELARQEEAAKLESYRADLRKSGHTNLHRLLMKNDGRHGQIEIRRKNHGNR